MKRITTITAVLALSLAAGASTASAGGPMKLGTPPPRPSVAVVHCDSLLSCADLAVLCKQAGGKFTDTSTGTENLSGNCRV